MQSEFEGQTPKLILVVRTEIRSSRMIALTLKIRAAIPYESHRCHIVTDQ